MRHVVQKLLLVGCLICGVILGSLSLHQGKTVDASDLLETDVGGGVFGTLGKAPPLQKSQTAPIGGLHAPEPELCQDLQPQEDINCQLAPELCGFPQDGEWDVPVSDRVAPSQTTTDMSWQQLKDICDDAVAADLLNYPDGAYRDAAQIILNPTPETVGADVYVIFWGALGICQGHNAMLFANGDGHVNIQYPSYWPKGDAQLKLYGTNVWNHETHDRADMPFSLDVMLEGTPHRTNYWERPNPHLPEVIIKLPGWNAAGNIGAGYVATDWSDINNCAHHTQNLLNEIGIALPTAFHWTKRWGPWRPSYIYQALKVFDDSNTLGCKGHKFEFLYRPAKTQGPDYFGHFNDQMLQHYFAQSQWCSPEVVSLFKKMWPWFENPDYVQDQLL